MGGQRRPGIAQRHDAAAPDIGGRPQRLGVDDAVVGRIGLVEQREARLVGDPVELARIDDDAADGVAVPADIFGERVHDDVGAEVEGAAQIRRRHGVVDDQRHAVPVGDLGQPLDVDDIARRVADRFAEHRLGPLVDGPLDGIVVVRLRHADLEALAREGVHEQIVGAAIELADGDDVVADAGDRLDGVGDGGHAGRHHQPADAALHLGDALLQHRRRRVHDARVDVAGDLEVEQVGAMLGIVERIRGGLVDRHGGRLGRGLGRITVVQRQRFELHEWFLLGARRFPECADSGPEARQDKYWQHRSRFRRKADAAVEAARPRQRGAGRTIAATGRIPTGAEAKTVSFAGRREQAVLPAGPAPVKPSAGLTRQRGVGSRRAARGRSGSRAPCSRGGWRGGGRRAGAPGRRPASRRSAFPCAP